MKPGMWPGEHSSSARYGIDAVDSSWAYWNEVAADQERSPELWKRKLASL